MDANARPSAEIRRFAAALHAATGSRDDVSQATVARIQGLTDFVRSLQPMTGEDVQTITQQVSEIFTGHAAPLEDVDALQTALDDAPRAAGVPALQLAFRVRDGPTLALRPGRHHHSSHLNALTGPELQQQAMLRDEAGQQRRRDGERRGFLHHVRMEMMRRLVERDEQRIRREEREEDEEEIREMRGWKKVVLSEDAADRLWEEWGIQTYRDGSLWVRYRPQY